MLYLDTARLGRACPSALQAQLDFARLSADDPSMYSENFLRDGSKVWPKSQVNAFPAFSSWGGVRELKTCIAQHFNVPRASSVFLANRSAQLVRAAASLMFRSCRNVLTSDLNWPHWQGIVNDEAARRHHATTVARVRDMVFCDRVSADELCDQLTATYFKMDCDGLFLPVVNNQGIRLPLSKLLDKLKASGKLRFALVDAAQSFGHLSQPAPTQLADVTIAGCHKWLRGSLPLGVAVCGSPLVAEQFQLTLKQSTWLDDPLSRFTQQIVSNSVNKYSETVNLAPLFTANAAMRSPRVALEALDAQSECQTANAIHIQQALADSPWRVVSVDDSLRTGIILVRSSTSTNQTKECNELRERFRNHRIVLSTYPMGIARISIPTTAMTRESADTLASAFARIA